MSDADKPSDQEGPDVAPVLKSDSTARRVTTASRLVSTTGRPSNHRKLSKSEGSFVKKLEKRLKKLTKAVNKEDITELTALLGAPTNCSTEDEDAMLQADTGKVLQLACRKGSLQAALVLLRHRAPINSTGEGDYAPLHLASIHGNNSSLVALLLSHGANPDIPSKSERKSSLHLAALHGNKEDVLLLVEHRADVNKGDIYGQTPLHIAARIGQLEIVKTLIEWKANVNDSTKDGWTALHVAAAAGHHEVVKLLMNSKASINPQTKHGRTALHWATISGHLQVIHLLLNSDANVFIVDVHGKKPLDYAHDAAIRQVLAIYSSQDEDAPTAPSTIGSLINLPTISPADDSETSENDTGHNSSEDEARDEVNPLIGGFLPSKIVRCGSLSNKANRAQDHFKLLSLKVTQDITPLEKLLEQLDSELYAAISGGNLRSFAENSLSLLEQTNEWVNFFRENFQENVDAFGEALHGFSRKSAQVHQESLTSSPKKTGLPNVFYTSFFHGAAGFIAQNRPRKSWRKMLENLPVKVTERDAMITEVLAAAPDEVSRTYGALLHVLESESSEPTAIIRNTLTFLEECELLLDAVEKKRVIADTLISLDVSEKVLFGTPSSYTLASQLAGDGKKLGHSLGICGDRLSQIWQQMGGASSSDLNSNYHANMFVLSVWRNEMESAGMADLALALVEIGREDLLNTLTRPKASEENTSSA